MSTTVLQRAQQRAGALGAGLYAAVLAFALLAVAGAVGLGLSQPWLFPSLGPTVMLFFESPGEESSRPGHTLVGHLVGIAVGWAMLHLFALQGLPPAPVGGLTAGHVLAGALSVALTSLVLVAVKHQHPPAGASTLIVSLGILSRPSQLLTMVLAVLLVTSLGWALNLLLGQRIRA
ncbi:HPP family protein [Pedococcus sp. 2YAF34]|uniref:HPP family protein n=1 Tax=Pedococcus sp. 2YAF34 TaxID=3233032 RepID=UPI003F94D759